MKSLIFVSGVAVGSIATVGAAVAAALISLNKITEGEVKKTFLYALKDIRNVVDGVEREPRTRAPRQYGMKKEEDPTCDSPSGS